MKNMSSMLNEIRKTNTVSIFAQKKPASVFGLFLVLCKQILDVLIC